MTEPQAVDASAKTPLPECAVCMEPYLPPSVPKSMPCCGHTVCLKCLLRLERESDSRMITCPECRTPSKLSRNGVEAFQTNIAIQRIVSQLQGISFQESATTYRPRKNHGDVPLSAPSFVSHSKGLLMNKPSSFQAAKKASGEKRPQKPLPIPGDGQVDA